MIETRSTTVLAPPDEEVTLQHPQGAVRVTPLPNGRRRIAVEREAVSAAARRTHWDTAYPVDLIELILQTKGPGRLIDEIRRDEAPAYVARHLEAELLAYLPRAAFRGRRILDFGCGAGASTMVLARMFPEATVVGIELQERLLEIARARARFYEAAHVSFRRSRAPDRLPDDLGQFDAVILSAVFEHLLPRERPRLLSMLWSALRPGGVLFLNQTPFRYFPVEMHTSRLPLINYLPDRLAHAVARLLSPRVSSDESWEALLRRGIRGGTVGEILRTLRAAGDGAPVVLEPTALGCRDRIDLWFLVSADIRGRRGKQLLRLALKAVRGATGICVVPNLALAIEKGGAAAARAM